jgi:hypothetical protein
LLPKNDGPFLEAPRKNLEAISIAFRYY